MMGWYNNGTMGAGGWVAMVLMMSLVWGGVIVAGILIFRGTRTGTASSTGAPGGRRSHRDAREILDERFARGELDNEEYEARRAVLLDTRD